MNRISCDNARRLMPVYLSSELTAEPLAEFSNHLAGCSLCFNEAERQIALDRELRDAVLSEPSTAARTKARVRDHIRREGRHRWIAMSLAITAAVAMAIAVFASARLVGPLEAAAKDHIAEVVDRQPRHWVPSPQVAGLATKMGVPKGVPDLTPEGYTLDRGRACKLGEDTWLHLVYRGAVHEISVFLRPDDGQSEMRTVAVDGVSVAAVGFGAGKASIVTDSRDECRVIAERLMRSGDL